MCGYGARMPRLEVAATDAWLEAFGVEPRTEEVTGDEFIKELRIPAGAVEELHLTWDVADDSVRVRLRQAGRVVVDLYREQATVLGVERDGSVTAVIIEYRTTDSAGRAHIQVTPQILIEDKVLRT
jgi:hypothetical protein